MYLLGFDIGSSSVKAALVDADTGKAVKVVQYPDQEMSILSMMPGWAEQDPEWWWQAVCKASQRLISQSGSEVDSIRAIGIAYQMHGLVLVDNNKKVVRPSIIWCDSRAVEIGEKVFNEYGKEHCLSRYLNSPGNFTASRMKWIKEYEPEVYDKVDKMMLPGDYIAMRMTEEVSTTVSGLSEGIMWDFIEHTPATDLLDHMGISPSLIPEVKSAFEFQGELTDHAAEQLGLKPGIAVTYRAGDQPNNAFSLGVLNANEAAATGGTSGVIYGVTDQPLYDQESRVNGFVHVNHTPEAPRVGILLCINGAGILYSWMKRNMVQEGLQYKDMEKLAEKVAIGSEGLTVLPFGNGAERVLNNQNPGAHISNLHFNRHHQGHFLRASLEGIAFSFVYGFQVMKEMGIETTILKVGNDNLFQSKVFSETICHLIETPIQVRNTTGAIGAARGAGYGAGIYQSIEDVLIEDELVHTYHPDKRIAGLYKDAYSAWEKRLIQLTDIKKY